MLYEITLVFVIIVTIITIAAVIHDLYFLKVCRICGAPGHTKHESHLNKTQLYKMVAHSIDLVGRTKLFEDELADVFASFMGQRIILIRRGRHRIGWILTAAHYMRHDAEPQPTKFLLPNSIVLWKTDSASNLPEGAPEYKVRKILVPFSASWKCKNCGTDIEITDFDKKRVSCNNCGNRYSIEIKDNEVVHIWGRGFQDTTINFQVSG